MKNGMKELASWNGEGLMELIQMNLVNFFDDKTK